MADTSTIYCIRCGYRLDGLKHFECPECGHKFDPINPETFRTTTKEDNYRTKIVVSIVTATLAPLVIPLAILVFEASQGTITISTLLPMLASFGVLTLLPLAVLLITVRCLRSRNWFLPFWYGAVPMIGCLAYHYYSALIINDPQGSIVAVVGAVYSIPLVIVGAMIGRVFED